ncbi:hypothetical protein NPIL_120831 [Nephila pilipes]|uniref:Uncharacterized protein n=1 Tax=Nephila pilipes TaxID=299642 RepID=A0A8X6UK02_NEPPI|nr:hypothetical protein NPIL_120831 [Nephila pilipes]
MTMLGTIRQNKPELPEKNVKQRSAQISLLFNCCKLHPKKNKNVILISTLSHDREASSGPDKNPQMILRCNAIKGTMDTLDQLFSA